VVDGPQALAEVAAVGEGAQLDDALQPLAQREVAGRGAGGEQCAVEPQPVAGPGHDLAGAQVQGGGGVADPQGDVMLGVEVLAVDVDLVDGLVADQETLGQRGALVGALGLLGEQRDPTLEVLGPCCLCRLGGGESAADDDDVADVLAHVISPGQAVPLASWRNSWRAAASSRSCP